MLLPFGLLSFFFLPNTIRAQGPYPDGEFVYPPNLEDETPFDRFPNWTVGTSVTIEWNTTYRRSNLFFSQFGNDGPSQLLATNTDKSTFDWEVKTASVYPNLSIPFHFHIVNPEGTAEDQFGGGIWSSGFFISLDENLSPSETETISTPSATPSGVMSFSSGLPSTTSASNSGNTTNPQPSDAASSKGLSSGGIAGAVVGGIGILATVVAFIYWMRRRREHMRPKIAPIQEQQYDAAPQYSSYYSKPHYADGNMHYMAPVPVEAPGQRDMAEADGTSRPAPPPAEMEGHAVGSTR